MTTNPSAYDSLQRVLSTRRGGGPASPGSPSSRKPIPTFVVEPAPLPPTGLPRKRVVSRELSWYKMKEVLEVEYACKGRAPPLLEGTRTVLVKDLEAASDNWGRVKVVIFSNAVLVRPEERFPRPVLVTAANVKLIDSTLVFSSPTFSSRILLDPSPSLPSHLKLFTAPPSSLTPRSPSSSSWTPDSHLSLCECCSTVRFDTFTRIHHCRALSCGRGICARCSRWRMSEGEEAGKRERVCKDCFEKEKEGDNNDDDA